MTDKPFPKLRALVGRQRLRRDQVVTFGPVEATELISLLADHGLLATRAERAHRRAEFVRAHRTVIAFALRWLATEQKAALIKLGPNDNGAIGREAAKAWRALERAERDL